MSGFEQVDWSKKNQKMDERNKRGVRTYDWPKKKPEPRLFIVEQYSNLDCDTQCVTVMIRPLR